MKLLIKLLTRLSCMHKCKHFVYIFKGAQILTFRSGLAISGNILQNGLITSKNLTETKRRKIN